MAQNDKLPAEINQLLDLLMQAEEALSSVMDDYDNALFALPEWLRMLEHTNRLKKQETDIQSHRGLCTPGIIEAWGTYQDFAERLERAQREVTQIEYAIAVFPASNLNELAAKSRFAMAVFYNTYSTDPYLNEEPKGMDELIAFHLDQDIQRMAQACRRKDSNRRRHA